MAGWFDWIGGDRVRMGVATAILLIAVALVASPPDAAAAKTLWLCKPGLRNNPCEPGLGTTVYSPAGVKLRVKRPARARPRPVDCFYIYPTVSDVPGPQAPLRIDPEQRSIALYQAARYSQYCRVYAPIYRQLTLSGIGGAPGGDPDLAYRDVRAGWRDYLKRHNRGRGVVLVSHSQGTYMLRRLVREEIDRRPAVRRRLVSALLLGGDVTVKKGRDAGGDFNHVRACRSPRQLSCVVAYSTFDTPVPADSPFGRAPAGREVLCTNPAALGGGAGVLDSIYPSEPFAPGVIGSLIPQIGPLPTASTTWIEIAGAYRARCSSADHADVLQVSPLRGAPRLNPVPANFGLHLTDANLPLGNLMHLVRIQARHWVRRYG
jgi:hypothetical protein